MKPDFNRRIFWDVDFNSLDFEKKAAFVIQRVFERGDVDDIRTCRRYYGDTIIKNALTQAKWLPLNAIYLACALFENELTDYKCYNIAQSNPGHWTY
jgi:hypothetical protein